MLWTAARGGLIEGGPTSAARDNGWEGETR